MSWEILEVKKPEDARRELAEKCLIALIVSERGEEYAPKQRAKEAAGYADALLEALAEPNPPLD